MDEKFPQKAKNIMNERFGRDTLLSLATADKNIPYVRTVNAFYENGCFYIITYAKSRKMQQIENNPMVAVSGDWFNAHGRGVNLGWFCKESNHEIAQKLRGVFSEWIDNGHNNFDDENTIILRIQLTDGILFSHGTRYNLNFSGD